MLEELCRTAFYQACRAQEEKTPLVALKGKPWKKVNIFENFFDSLSSFTFWQGLPLKKAMNSRRDTLLRKSWVWMNESAYQICEGYVLKHLNGNLEAAMLDAGSFSKFFDDFKIYFKNRRTMFMERTEQALSERKNELAKSGKTPQSHGGVANLLKVLTKTMHDQGSTILTIAKVQYAVCIQAGIYIPEEFLTDVLVAQEIMEDAE